MVDLIGTKAMARLAGVTPRAVRHARETGRLTATADGKYDPEQPRNALFLRGHRARTAPDQANRQLDAKIAAAVSKLRLAKDRYETARERYVDRAEAVRVAGDETDYVLERLRASPARHAAAVAQALAIEPRIARRILNRFIALALVEIGDLRAEAIRAAETV